jgi:hypothetical protein
VTGVMIRPEYLRSNIRNIRLVRTSEIREKKMHLNPLTAFGLFAVTAMVLCYAFEKRSPWFVLGFALSCVLGSVYGFLQGAWPFGLVEGVWSVIAARRWWLVRRTHT